MLDLLAEAVGPGGRIVGLDADPAHVTAARQYASSHGLANVEVLAGDAGTPAFPRILRPGAHPHAARDHS